MAEVAAARLETQVSRRSISRAETVTNYDDFLAMEGEWNRLLEEAGIDQPFLRHEWLRSWWDSFGHGNELHIVVLRDEDRPVAIAPLMRNETRMLGLKVRRLQSIYNVHTPRTGFIVAPNYEDSWRRVWDEISASEDSWDLIELNQLPAGSATLREIQDLARADGFSCGGWWSGDSPYVAIDRDWQAYLKGLARKHRSNMKNRLNRLNRLGEVEVELVSEPGSRLDDALEDGLRIEAAAWKGQHGTAIRCEDDIRTFYSLYADRAARGGLLRLHFLKVDGRRIAFAYSASYGNKLYLLKTGYDPEYSRYSPFNVLCMKVLEESFEKGLEEYDFLGVHDQWKRSWTELARPHYWLYVFSRSIPGRLIYGAKFNVIPKVKDVLRLGSEESTPFVARIADKQT